VTKTIFAKIIDRELPADIVYEDDVCLAFKDVNPVAPFHVLVIPKREISKLAESQVGDAELLGTLLQVAAKVASDGGYANAFRVIINNGAKAGQTVFHLHLHVIAGRSFSWPPG